MKKFAVIAMTLMMTLSLFACGGSGKEKEPTTTEAQKQEYTGVARGFGGDVTVTLICDGKEIVDVVVTHKNESTGMGGKEAIEDGTYKNQILAAQGGEIEGVARASFTTKAVKAAYKAALDQMNGVAN